PRGAAALYADRLLAGRPRGPSNLVHGVAHPTSTRLDADRAEPTRGDGASPVRPIVQCRAGAGTHGPDGRTIRRPRAGGLRHDRGQPPDGLEPAARSEERRVGRGWTRRVSQW